MHRRWWWLLAGLAVSAAVTAVLWLLHVPGIGFFLFLPFVLWPSLGREGEHQARYGECPKCGWVAPDGEARFCPKDGTKLN